MVEICAAGVYFHLLLGCIMISSTKVLDKFLDFRFLKSKTVFAVQIWGCIFCIYIGGKFNEFSKNLQRNLIKVLTYNE